MINVFDMALHTKFAEDFFECPSFYKLNFHLNNNLYESDIVDVKAIFNYCKNKYNYMNNDIHYFNDVVTVNVMQSCNIYFDIKNYKFIIPLESIDNVDNLILFGSIREEEFDKIIKMKEKGVLMWSNYF